MKRSIEFIVAIGMMVGMLQVSTPARAADTIPIVKTSKAALTVEATAARELGEFLRIVYPKMTFPVGMEIPARGDCILFGTRASLPLLAELVTDAEVAAPGSFVVKHVERDGRTLGVICGQDARGAMDGVYRFLEAKLGIAFYFNEVVWENKVAGPFDWKLWEHTDKPLFPYRGMNPFHAFYGSPTAMNFEEWKDYLARIARTGINWVNIHTYEHYGVRQFEFRGVKNFAQDITSTRYGGEWSTRNVWDMRQMPFGGKYYDFPILGSDSVHGSTVEERIALEKRMYEKFIRFGLEQHGIKTYELLDMDNYGRSAFDQEQILELPESDRILSKKKGRQHGGDRWVPNVDTPGGYAFVKAQVKQVIDDRPSLAGLAVCFRGVGVNPNCLDLAYEEMPENWQREMDGVYAKHPELDAAWDQRCYHFFHAKTANAFSRILKELGREDMHVGIGWWSRPNTSGGVECVRFMDAILDPRVAFTLGGWHQNGIEFGHAEYRKAIQSANRMVVMIPYLQADVGRIIGGTGVWHIGDGLSAKAQEMNLDGTFMTHFASRPTDLKQKYWINNLWEATRSETRKTAEERFARDWFGGGKTTTEMIDYARALSAFEGFGELCCNMFYDWGIKPLRFEVNDLRKEITRYENALELGKRIDQATLSDLAKAHLNYYQGYLLFTKTMLEHSYALHYKDREDLPKDPFEVAKLFVAALEACPKHEWSRVHAIDKGQIAEIYGRFIRQVLWRYKVEGLYPYYGGKCGRIGNHDKAFYVDPDGIARPVIQADVPRAGTSGFAHPDLKRVPANREESVADSYLETDARQFSYEADGEQSDLSIMPKGRYQVEVFFPSWIVKSAGERVVRLSVEGGAAQEVDLFADGRMAKVVTLNDVAVTDGALDVKFEAVQGKLAISGVFATLKERLHPQDPPKQPNASWKFDFGPADAPVAEGYTQVTEQTDYRGEGLGYGWREAVGMLATHHPGKDALADDFVESRIYRVFQADVPNGTYRVHLRMGDPKDQVTTCNIIIEGNLQESNLRIKKGEIITRTFDVRVDDGRLDIGLSSSGQWAARWCVNAIEVEPVREGAKLAPNRVPEYQEASAIQNNTMDMDSHEVSPCPCGQ